MTDMIEKLKKAKWRWAGHLMRRKLHGWSKGATEWISRDVKKSLEGKNVHDGMIFQGLPLDETGGLPEVMERTASRSG